MLELINLNKIYKTEAFEHYALNNIDLAFRSSEFVSILGPSGSGKTTLLNIIGGLDQYTSGNLKINGRSTKDFRQEDWDSYRNNSVGFIFQSYNLINHLSVIENVEMGMTLSGVSSKERRKRSQAVLKKVGLEKHINKNPNQLSGGQMQRVAIARALVNDPDIILADEPTGALDHETSIQIMELIKEIASEKLVIMVTHNPELAHKYSERIIEFMDGTVKNDSNPYLETEATKEYEFKKTNMSFLTALKLSGKNILTKKWRTSLTALASSIGIIGIALVLALSNGLGEKMTELQTSLLSGYPVTVSDGPQIIMEPPTPLVDSLGEEIDAYQNNETIVPYSNKNEVETHINNLTSEYIDYVYQIDEALVSGFSTTRNISIPILKSKDGVATSIDTRVVDFTTYSTNSQNDKMSYLEEHYDVLEGELPQKKTDLVLVLNENNQINDEALEELGFPNKELKFSEVVGKEYKLIYNDTYYKKSDKFFQINGDPTNLSNLYENEDAVTLEITGVIRLKEDATVSGLKSGIAYSDELAQDFINNARNSEIVNAQESADYNVLTGGALGEEQKSLQMPFEDPLSGPQGMIQEQLPTKEQLLDTLGANDVPQSISVYPIDFEAKEEIVSYLDSWNEGLPEEDQLVVTDSAEMMTSMITNIVNIISYVLIAFASISLVVSVIMIAIIIYVSVIERTKEIGVLRALGARKKDISRVFNAETFIIGAVSGILAITITVILTIPINKIIESLTEFAGVAQLNPLHAIGLIIMSICLTVIGGLIPSKMAAKKNPVEALRSE
ncbi:ABC transporter ATP-binding protein/permease [Lysinibacillus fusiformis]|uniref:ABC transporter ATP-binding protein/permease n=1 Tax=Lysinibacillus fusiformis TaxID=28031 RepID=UPI002E993503|nr:ABC transporter ATP-binding protein/permease [Lysinibacillus fusiformis]